MVKIVLGVDCVFVDFEDDIATGNAGIVGEGAGLDVLDDDALTCWNVEPVGHFIGDGAHVQSQFALFGSGRFAAFILFSQAGREQLGAIRDGDSYFLLLAVANITDHDFGAGLAAGDVGDQFVAILDGLAIDGNDGVAYLEAGLISRSAGNDAGDGDAALYAINARDGGIFLRGELNTDRAAGDAMIRSDELVVDGDHGV